MLHIYSHNYHRRGTIVISGKIVIDLSLLAQKLQKGEVYFVKN